MASVLSLVVVTFISGYFDLRKLRMLHFILGKNLIFTGTTKTITRGKIAHAVMLLTFIWKVPSSNLG